MNFIRWTYGVLVRALLPSSGRHRAGRGAARVPDDRRGAGPAARPMARVAEPVLRGEDIQLVRPYVAWFERRREAQRQRERRRAVWLALHGVDVGPRVIHGVRVAG
jgi:hypothetical protein